MRALPFRLRPALLHLSECHTASISLTKCHIDAQGTLSDSETLPPRSRWFQRRASTGHLRQPRVLVIPLVFDGQAGVEGMPAPARVTSRGPVDNTTRGVA